MPSSGDQAVMGIPGARSAAQEDAAGAAQELFCGFAQAFPIRVPYGLRYGLGRSTA